MLGEEEIRKALRAGRVVPLAVPNPHGPLRLEQLADGVARIADPAQTVEPVLTYTDWSSGLLRIRGKSDR
jgi:hypothetical protein